MKWGPRTSIFLGNLLEHYDQALYGLLAPYFATLFFPFENPIYSLLAAYALLPLGVISKPLGAFVFGALGTKYGTNRSLMITLVGIAAATFAMGCLPTYQTAGIWSPVLLGCCRLLQSFFGAGEKVGGAIAVLDDVEEKKQPFVGSLLDASGMIGIALASGATASFLFLDISWRWLFWLGALTGWIAWSLRKLPTVERERRAPTLNLLWNYRREIVLIGCVSGFSYANYYLLTTFLNGFLPLVSPISVQEALAMNTWLLVLDFLLLPFLGWLAIHPETWIRRALFASSVCSIPLYLSLEGATIVQAAIVRVALMIIGIALAAPYHAWAIRQAPKEHRFFVVGVGSALGSRLIGAPAPAVALFLYHQWGFAWAPAIPLVCSALFALYFLRKKVALPVQST